MELYEGYNEGKRKVLGRSAGAFKRTVLIILYLPVALWIMFRYWFRRR